MALAYSNLNWIIKYYFFFLLIYTVLDNNFRNKIRNFMHSFKEYLIISHIFMVIKKNVNSNYHLKDTIPISGIFNNLRWSLLLNIKKLDFNLKFLKVRNLISCSFIEIQKNVDISKIICSWAIQTDRQKQNNNTAK